jgi:citrate lyase subunit beta/citryl-CoA lyase
VKIVNAEYSPSAAEVEFARKVIEMNAKYAAEGRGSFQIDGKMIDIPIVVRAEKLLRRHEKIRAREARTLAAAS